MMLFSLGKLACWPLALGLLGSVSAKSKSKPCASNNYECIKTMCQIYYGWTTDSGTYLYGTNQWGWDDSGAQCMTVDIDDADGYATFNATWSWEERPVWVHSYPNVGYESQQLPTQLSNVNSFQLNSSWAVYPATEHSASTSISALDALGTKANVALDIFLSADATDAGNASAADVEIMVWGAQWGGVWPIGYYLPTDGAPEMVLDGVTFQLFVGHNKQGQEQQVFSWVPVDNTDGFNADIYPLIQTIIDAGNLSDTMYMGLIQFGSETVHASANVTIEMKSAYMSLDVKSARPTTATATSTSKAGAWGSMPTITSLPMVAAGLAAVAQAVL